MTNEHRIGQAKGSKRQFESGLNAIFTDARNISVQMVQDAQSYADEIQRVLSHLDKVHSRQISACQVMTAQPKTIGERIDSQLSVNSSSLDELTVKRVQLNDTMENNARGHSAHMRKARMRFMRSMQRRLDERREQQQLISDATAFIKHYKSLVLTA